MKKRSEVVRKRSEVKASAVERTVPLPIASQFVPLEIRCPACEEVTKREKMVARPDGALECPECGNAVLVDATAKAPQKPSSSEESASPKIDLPAARWCGTCGSEWPLVNGKLFVNCGHTDAKPIDDPRKATKYGPPAPLGVRVDHEIARRDADDAKKGASKSVEKSDTFPVGLPLSGFPSIPGLPAGATVSGNRLSIPWGEARMPIDQWNNFKCGGFIVSMDLPPGADRVEAATKILDDLEKIADIAFQREHAWYLKKLGILSK